MWDAALMVSKSHSLTNNGFFSVGSVIHETETSSEGSVASNFRTMNPTESGAGIAETYLDVSRAVAGTTTVSAIVERPGSSILLSQDIRVVGPTSATGLLMNLAPNDLDCGKAILVSVFAVDSLGQPAVDGTTVYLICENGARFEDLRPEADGIRTDVVLVNGTAGITLITDPLAPGTHSVRAYVQAPDANGNLRPSVATGCQYTTTLPGTR